MSLPTASIVVPTTGRADRLAATLDCLTRLEYPAEARQILVVDDSGGNPETAKLAGAAPHVSVMATSGRCGAATARNRGAAAAEGELLVFCDDDVLVGADHLLLHAEAQRRHPGALVNGVSAFAPEIVRLLRNTSFGRYRLDLEQRFEKGVDGEPTEDGCRRVTTLSARNLALRRELFWELGGFDEDFPFAGAEDEELSIRAAAAGCTLLRDHRIRVLNNEPIVTLRQFCEREERSARTAVVLARKHPDHAAGRPLVRENAPIARGDPPRLRLRKAAKRLLSHRMALAALGQFAERLELLPIGDRPRQRIYSGVVGLHIFRGVRAQMGRGPG